MDLVDRALLGDTVRYLPVDVLTHFQSLGSELNGATVGGHFAAPECGRLRLTRATSTRLMTPRWSGNCIMGSWPWPGRSGAAVFPLLDPAGPASLQISVKLDRHYICESRD